MISSAVLGQEIIDNLVMYNYSTVQGLPSNQLLSAFQDSKGFIWFGTGGGGVVRYDGSTFEVFDMSNGMLDNEVFSITEDHRGRIWFGTYSMRLTYYENGEIYPYLFNDRLKSIGRSPRLKQVYMDERDHLFLSFVNHAMVEISSEGQFVETEKDDQQIEIYVFNEKNILLSKVLPSYPKVDAPDNVEWHGVIHDYSRYDNIVGSLELPFCVLPRRSVNRWNMVVLESEFVLFSRCSIFSIDRESLQIKEELLNYQIMDIINVNYVNGEYWVLTQTGLVVGTIVHGEFIVSKKIFEGIFTTVLLEDDNGGLWVGTHNKGVYHIPNPKNVSIPKRGDWFVQKKNICVSSTGDVFYSVESDKIVCDTSGTPYVVSIKTEDDGYVAKILLSQHEDSLFVLSSNSLSEIALKTGSVHTWKTRYGSDLIEYKPSHFLQVGGGYVSLWRPGNKPKLLVNNTPNLTHCIGVMDNRIFIGTNKGLYEVLLIGDSMLSVVKPYDLIGGEIHTLIVDIENYKDGFWFAAPGVGVGFFKDSLVNLINSDDGLSSLKINELEQDKDTLWVSTSYGLNKLIVNDRFEVEKITVFNENNGLSSSDIAGAELCKEYIYISSSKGVDIIKRGEVAGREESSTFFIKSVSARLGEGIVQAKDYAFSYDNNDLIIQLEAIQFNALGYHDYRYKLEPSFSEWRYTQSDDIEFNNLYPDAYMFTAEIKNNIGEWEQRQSVKITVVPPFWTTYWFVGLIVLFVIAGIYWFVKRMEKRIKHENEVQLKIQELKGKALRAQVNPHFIFNTLNAIQNYVLEGDFEQSNKFITRFARLIRMILRYSSDELILLENEIEMLNKYLEVEQMRFSNKFEYTISISEDIPTNQLFVQSMLIQPYVENAIWHGMVDPENKGRIEVLYKLIDDKTLYCVVKDNGIGRVAAESRKSEESKNRKSIGMTLPNERIKAFSNSTKDFVEVLDLYDDGKPIGTEIRIIIPYKNKIDHENSNR